MDNRSHARFSGTASLQSYVFAPPPKPANINIMILKLCGQLWVYERLSLLACTRAGSWDTSTYKYEFDATALLTAAAALVGLTTGLLLPQFWTIPAAFALTLPYHLVVLFLARVEPHGSTRIFSRGNTVLGFTASIFWTGAFGTAIVTTVLMLTRHERGHDVNLAGALGALSLIEGGVVWSVAVISYKERRKLSYAAKWRPIPMASTGQAWRYAALNTNFDALS
ncbi:hypothetical protein PQX77_000415 [Marasmius sp. AFHP31]|nr:hypothetical protein PQX77_000415 [Marasmius sp. AFHP31]